MAATNKSDQAIIIKALDGLVSRRLIGIKRLVYVDKDIKTGSPDWVIGLSLQFSGKTLRIEVDPDLDTLSIKKAPFRPNKSKQLKDAKGDEPWLPWIGKKLMFGWACINNSGYLDGIQLGFDHYKPSISLLAVGSGIHEYSVVERPAKSRKLKPSRQRRSR